MTNKRKKLARKLAGKTGVSYAGAINMLTKPTVKHHRQGRVINQAEELVFKVSAEERLITLDIPADCSGVLGITLYRALNAFFDEDPWRDTPVPLQAYWPHYIGLINKWRVEPLEAIRCTGVNTDKGPFTSVTVQGKLPAGAPVTWQIQGGPSGQSPWTGLPNDFLVPYVEGALLHVASEDQSYAVKLELGRVFVPLVM